MTFQYHLLLLHKKLFTANPNGLLLDNIKTAIIVEHMRFFLDAARQKYALLLITSMKAEVKNLYLWPCPRLVSNGLCFSPFQYFLK